MLDAIKNAIWWCLVLSGAGGGNGGGLHWMIVKFGEEELCWWISNVFLFVTVEDD
jgi:hypothetical protein